MNYIIKLNFTIFFFLSIFVNIAYSKSLKVVVFGDSLIAGYGLLKEDGFVNQLQNKVNYSKINLKLINSGVSGETSTGLYNRFKWVLEEEYDAVIVSIGANDALRGIDPKTTYKNLENILIHLKKNKIPTMLIGMKAPSNLGKEYVNEFNAIYPTLSKKYNVIFFPFFLKDVALEPTLNQTDMIHPNKKGVVKIIENIFPYFLRFSKSLLN
jgi:acyl-CoA thioesterase-1|tara:strand:- start:213 stop:845 length:633 start_codon:yes stop_codon:yes gene_type:complete